MPPKVRIYTRTGDKGETSLFGGKRVPKNNIRVEAFGTIDELNSLLGIILSKLSDRRVEEFVNQVQRDLFSIGSYLAGAKVTLEGLSERVEEMEKMIDTLDSQLPIIQNFILPEGTERSAFLYFGRAVARRAERELVSLSQEESVDKKIFIYFNRLSDMLFILARYFNIKAGVTETIWKGNKLD